MYIRQLSFSIVAVFDSDQSYSNGAAREKKREAMLKLFDDTAIPTRRSCQLHDRKE